jgi:hypothetical protein
MAEGRKTALVVLLGFALIGAVCVALSPFMTNEATGPAAARDCTGVCVEQIV